MTISTLVKILSAWAEEYPDARIEVANWDHDTKKEVINTIFAIRAIVMPGKVTSVDLLTFGLTRG